MAYNPEFYNKLSRFGKDRIIEKYVENGTLTSNDERLIVRYIRELKNEKNIGIHRETKLASTLSLWRLHLPKEYKDINIDDVYQAKEEIQNSEYTIQLTKRNGEKADIKPKKYTQNTFRDYVAVLRPFLIWLIENNENKKLIEKKVRAIKIPSKDYNTTQPEDLPSYDEVLIIIDGCQQSLHKAFMSLLYESGCRIGECLRLTWKDVHFENIEGHDTVRVYIDDQKTKKQRLSRLTISAKYLANYKNFYWAKYGEPTDNDFVFISRQEIKTEKNGKIIKKNIPFTYAGASQIFSRMVKRSLDKKITPHDFRRARATHMIQQNYQESIIKESLWGNVNTPQFQVYAKLSNKDIDKEFLARAGIKTNEIKVEDGPITCGKCHTINNSGLKHCGECGYPLTKEGIAALKNDEEEAAKLAINPDVLQKMIDDAVKKQIKAMTSSKA